MVNNSTNKDRKASGAATDVGAGPSSSQQPRGVQVKSSFSGLRKLYSGSGRVSNGGDRQGGVFKQTSRLSQSGRRISNSGGITAAAAGDTSNRGRVSRGPSNRSLRSSQLKGDSRRYRLIEPQPAPELNSPLEISGDDEDDFDEDAIDRELAARPSGGRKNMML